MVKTIYAGRVGQVVNIALKDDDGTPIDLTSAAVTLSLYSSGSNAAKWTQTCTVTDATNGLATYTSVPGDFATVGSYYSLVNAAYTNTSATLTVQDETYEIVSNEENAVTTSEFLKFLDIPVESAKSTDVLKQYLEDGETFLNVEIPALANTTRADWIKLKKTLIKFRAGILYFMNSDENFIDPNKRNPKI